MTPPPPPFTFASLSYTWCQLFKRIGVIGDAHGINLGVSSILIYYASPSTIKSSQPTLFVVPCAENAWVGLLQYPSCSIDWLPSDLILPAGVTTSLPDFIPVPFWGQGYTKGNHPFAQKISDHRVVFYADIIATTLFALSRWEETVLPDRDRQGRFPATASLAYKQGFLDYPIVDLYAMILCEWIKRLRPNWQPVPRSFSIKLSHDIDYIVRKPSLRKLAGDVVSKTNSEEKGTARKDLLRAIRDRWAARFAPLKNSATRRIYDLANFSKQYGLESAFYFMAKAPGDPLSNTGYDPRVLWIRHIIEDLKRLGFELGIHPSYGTLNNPEKLAEEKSILDSVLGHQNYGGRQHYLRFQTPNTWRDWEDVGLIYDSTLTYVDHEGFRCGTCHPFHPFDLEQDRELKLLEVPLIVMEGTLAQYRQMSPIEGLRRILTLARRCKAVGGTFTLLWHNTSFDYGFWRAWGDIYPQILSELAELL